MIKICFLLAYYFILYHLVIGQTYPIYKNTSSIAVLDQDSLFTKSEWGRNILNNVEDKVSKFCQENSSIENELENRRIKVN